MMLFYLPAVKKAKPAVRSLECIISPQSSERSHSSLWQKYSGVSRCGTKSKREGVALMGRPFLLSSCDEVFFLLRPFAIIKFYVSSNSGNALSLYLLSLSISDRESRWILLKACGGVSVNSMDETSKKIDRICILNETWKSMLTCLLWLLLTTEQSKYFSDHHLSRRQRALWISRKSLLSLSSRRDWLSRTLMNQSIDSISNAFVFVCSRPRC